MQASVVQMFDSGPWQNGQAPRTLTFDSKTIERTPLFSTTPTLPRHKVSYHHNSAVEEHHFGISHPMKPWRLTLTNQLVLGYGLDQLMDVYSSRKANLEEMQQFHGSDYLDFLQRVTPGLAEGMGDDVTKFNIGDDCPIFEGMWDYVSTYTGASLDAARKLINDQSEIAINWSGGLHHAKKSEASGFCYINDIVLAILQLLRYHPRVLYIDIDVHHGDGVESAFLSTDRVMTLSIHKYDPKEFFPGTGGFEETGIGSGKHHSLNVPLRDGIDDDSYVRLFKAIVEPVLDCYRPTAIVLQCGADSLGCDRLGCFNLNIKAHAACVDFVKGFGLPLLILGGGGYTPRNVSRLWAYETAVCLGVDLDNCIPNNIPMRESFGPNYELHPVLSNNDRYENKNTKKYLEAVRQRIMEHLRYLNGAPSVQMQEIPPDLEGFKVEIDEMILEEAKEREKGRKTREKAQGRHGELYV